MKCPSCNSTEHEPNARFCHVCGHQFDSGPKEISSVRIFNVNGVEFKMIQVKGGSFMMGAHKRIENVFTNENPGHSVHLDTFWIGETEVTQELWKAVMGDNPSTFKELKRWSLGAMIHSYKSRPVESVSWKDCQDFITKLNRLTHERFRLPTEAEWEYAARGGQQSHGYNYAGSDNPDDVAWYLDNSGNVGGPYCYSEKELQKLTKNHRQTHPVKLKSCNELGLYDMSGNVWEWCQEESSPRHLYPNDPTSPIIGYDAHIIRGGSCLRQSHESLISCSSSGYNASEDIGLRLALVSNANYK